MGHKYLENLWDGPVYVSEKVDGSQFSLSTGEDGVLQMRSRKQELFPTTTGGLFALAIQTVVSLADVLHKGYIYRAEAITKPCHNTLVYNRIPKGGLILFDVDKGTEDYMLPAELEAEADRVGLECVPQIRSFTEKPSMDDLKALVNQESILGGVMREGVVIKAYGRFGIDKKTIMGKLVREEFKEQHSTAWKNANPGGNDMVQNIITQYTTEARWKKAIQHLREQGKIDGAPQDIPLVLKEIQDDVLQDVGEQIKERLFAHFWKKEISRGITKGAPEFYKNLLVEESLD